MKSKIKEVISISIGVIALMGIFISIAVLSFNNRWIILLLDITCLTMLIVAENDKMASYRDALTNIFFWAFIVNALLVVSVSFFAPLNFIFVLCVGPIGRKISFWIDNTKIYLNQRKSIPLVL